MNPQQQPSASVYAIVLKLSSEFTAQIARPGVGAVVMKAVSAGRAPTVQELVALGQTEDFARLFSERLGYLVRLQRASILRAAGPFEGLKEGMYLCNATDEREARRVLEEDPLYKAGFIDREFTVRRWLIAI
ncbi:YciI family protein [Bradyrhizobium stylosanthis]|uniref:YciI family protein n=1 Tax=Bradyrhizobium stylosanthis TaxID=1803665 RepID=UPI0007C4968F|nr:YciI family protein [Bradyrhizobium stylosanthis]